ncbi:conjugal transfer protein [uncultured Cellulomonas sp.]|uniref:conjugal transfer protein n=1 Tax=uncultured Cellulomonas sp. TaxID=189682 RepID=UPI002612E5B2|nr:conjugal transfer protein [uncultured Cellulomonas sp.]
MSVSLKARRRSPASQEPEAAAESPAVASAQTWTNGPSLMTKAASVALWGCLLCGPVALGVAATAVAGGEGAPVAVAAPVAPGQVMAVGDSAVTTVSTWLTATRSDGAALQAIYPAAQWSTLPEVAPELRAGAVADVVDVGQGVWSVTVGVDVRTSEADAWVRRYYEVPVAAVTTAQGSMAQPLTLPAIVPAPGDETGAAVAYPVAQSSTGPLGSASGDFLRALLAGQGDITRYTSPGTSISAVTPAAFDEVVVRTVMSSEQVEDVGAPADGRTAQVLVEVVCGTGDGAVTAQYRLAFTARAGRWEVTRMQGTPVLGGARAVTQPAGGTS